MRHRSLLVFMLTAFVSASSFAVVADAGAQPAKHPHRKAGARVARPHVGGLNHAVSADRQAAHEARKAAKAHKAEARAARHAPRANEPMRPKDYSHDSAVPPGPPSPLGTTLLSESFDTGIPAGWAVVDTAGSGVLWSNLTGCGEPTNWSGGAGDVACVSSDRFGTAEFDTELRTPVINLSTFVAPATLTFTTNYQNFAALDFFNVDVSTSGAAGPWVNLQTWNEDHGGDHALPGVPVNLDISSVVGQANVMFRFHYFDPNTGDWDWYAQVDDVLVQATPGGGGGCVLTCPANQAVSNTAGLCSATPTYPAPTTSGQCSAIVCTPASGGTFPVGTTLVTCSEAPTGQGGPASCTFNVTVNDVEAPVYTCPADQEATLPPGETTVVINYPVLGASDNCPGVLEPSCVPPSGSSFPEGTSPIACTGADASGNSGGCGFNAVVTGEGGGPSIIEIPALSGVGLAGLALLLVGAAFVALRRLH